MKYHPLADIPGLNESHCLTSHRERRPSAAVVKSVEESMKGCCLDQKSTHSVPLHQLVDFLVGDQQAFRGLTDMRHHPASRGDRGWGWRPHMHVHVCVLSCVQLFVTLWTVALRPWNFPGKNTGVSFHFLLQGIFPTQGSNLCLLHWQADSLTSAPPGKPGEHGLSPQTSVL